MSEEKEILRRVQDGLFHLSRGLGPVVEARMKQRHGASWLHYASRAGGSSPSAPLDVYGLLKTMLDNWRELFDEAFQRNDRHRVRNFASMALEARNATAHLTLPLQDDEALRYLDAMHQLLRLVKADPVEVKKVKELYDAQRGSGAAPAAPAAPPTKNGAQPQLQLARSEAPARAIRPWIEVALPHPDVLANRFAEAEFAADLFAVDSGSSKEDYASPQAFFRITFVTEGLRRILAATLQRLSGSGGDPVIGLQTSFGGGKTHTMLAIYHLAGSADPAMLEGVGPLAEKAGIKGWRTAKRAVFVGSSKGADTSLVLKDGPRVHTLWGYLAWRLAGEAGLALVKEAEDARTNPGSELFVEVLRLAGPCVILLDEVVAYVRQLPDDRFEAFLSFVQSLTEAVKMVPGALLVGSLPESALEAGGPKGQAALARLEKVFGRVQSAWVPATGDETYEIVRRRLFQSLDGEGEQAREAVIKAFHEMYRKNAAEFPPEAKEGRYLELLRLSYPIHPELFDRLSKDWATLDKFQRTRGVLKLMANVIGVLWHQRVSDPLIMPARVPIAHERIRASILDPLPTAFGAVVDKEVDGEQSLPARMEANPSRRMAQLRAATRAARAVFLASAPIMGSPNAGLTRQGVRLACAEPGEQFAIFGDALRELTDQATYLYEEAGRAWFSTQATLNRLADECARALPEHEVDGRIVEFLREDAARKGSFHKVFAVPDDPTGVDEATALSLVILGPGAAHGGKGVAVSQATEAVTDTLLRCRASQRRFRNTLLFVAADEGQLAGAREAVRRALAWHSIVTDKRLQDNLTQAQAKDAADKARHARDGALRAVRGAWSHVLFPIKTESTSAGVPFDLDHLSITAKDRPEVPVAVYDKARADSIAKERLGPDTLALELKQLWPEDRPHLPLAEIAEWFTTYVYLPKLRDRVVLDTALREAIAKLDPAFGYADRYDASADRYEGLIWAQNAPTLFPDGAMLVLSEVAKTRLTATPPASGPAGPGLIVSPPGNKPTAPNGNGSHVPAPQPRPTRFWGSVEIDMVRPVKAFDAIVNNVVMELQRAQGAKIRIRLEIEADAAEGFPEEEIGIVRDNARNLKFDPSNTGFGD